MAHEYDGCDCILSSAQLRVIVPLRLLKDIYRARKFTETGEILTIIYGRNLTILKPVLWALFSPPAGARASRAEGPEAGQKIILKL